MVAVRQRMSGKGRMLGERVIFEVQVKAVSGMNEGIFMVTTVSSEVAPDKPARSHRADS
jgi:hypothetical protein